MSAPVPATAFAHAVRRLAGALGAIGSRGVGSGPPADPETIERDLDDEFAFHLDALAAELVAAGMSPDAARAAARARFGDLDRIRSRCRRIAMEDQIMLHRIHLAVTALLVAATIGLGALLVMTLRAQERTRAVAVQSRAQAELERERAQQVTAFLATMLVAAEPAEAGTAALELVDVLDAAAADLDRIDDPDVASRIRETIERARARLHDGSD